MIRFLLDENLRGLWTMIQRHNSRGLDLIDAERIGDDEQLPLGTQDPEILNWCEVANRILITFDKRTMPVHFHAHLERGQHSPGILMLRDVANWQEILEFLILAVYASTQDDWRDQINHIP